MPHAPSIKAVLAHATQRKLPVPDIGLVADVTTLVLDEMPEGGPENLMHAVDVAFRIIERCTTRRVQELLEANHALIERARAADENVRAAQAAAVTHEATKAELAEIRRSLASAGLFAGPGVSVPALVEKLCDSLANRVGKPPIGWDALPNLIEQ